MLVVVFAQYAAVWKDKVVYIVESKYTVIYVLKVVVARIFVHFLC